MPAKIAILFSHKISTQQTAAVRENMVRLLEVT